MVRASVVGRSDPSRDFTRLAGALSVAAALAFGLDVRESCSWIKVSVMAS